MSDPRFARLADVRPAVRIPSSPAALGQQCDGAYQRPPHVDLVDGRLVDLASARNTRLQVNMPPAHSKSETCSKYYPAWYILRHPERRVILCSYEATFAESLGRKARDIVEEQGPQAGVYLSDKRAAKWWETTRGGGMQTAGRGGPITGKHCHLMVIDDLIANSEEANSPTVREKTWDWLRSVALTRLLPGGTS